MSGSKPTLLYITSRGHSGSTLLELLLAGHSKITVLGEVKQLTGKRSGLCRCLKPILGECPFWSAVDRQLRAHGESLESLETMHEDHGIFARHNRAFFDAVAKVAEAPYLVDSSKSLGRLKLLLDLEIAPIRVIHLTRRPHGVVASNVRRGRDWREVSRNYTLAMMKTRELLHDQNPIEVHYEDLVRDPAGTLDEIDRALGIAFEPAQLDWAQSEGHVIAGNAIRFSEDSEIRLDRRWMRELPVWTWFGISWLTLPTRFASPRLYEAHLPYWKGEGYEAWRLHRGKRARRRRRERRTRWSRRLPALKSGRHLLREWWQKRRRHGES